MYVCKVMQSKHGKREISGAAAIASPWIFLSLVLLLCCMQCMDMDMYVCVFLCNVFMGLLKLLKVQKPCLGKVYGISKISF